MSNYVYVVASMANRHRISEHFKQYGAGNFCSAFLPMSSRHDDGHAVYFASPSAARFMTANGSVFRGFAISTPRREVLFTPPPGRLRGDYFEGCFINAEVVAHQEQKIIEIRNDVFGQLPVFYFSSSDVFACSDSLLALTELRKELGLKNTLNESVFQAKMGKNAFCDQLVSTGTVVHEISYSLPGTVLHVECQADEVLLKTSHRGAPDIYRASDLNYAESIREAADSMAGLMAGLLGVEERVVRHDLSGGLDSRLALAASLASGESRERLLLGSSPRLKSELTVAQVVADAIGIGLNAPDAEKSLNSPLVSPFPLWFAASAGVYDPLYSLHVRNRTMNRFLVGGHGAELYKGNYGWKPIARVAKGIQARASRTSPHLEREAKHGLECFGIDPDSPSGSEWHYVAFRNALHSGRVTNASLYGVRPILNRRLVGLAHKCFTQTKELRGGVPSIISDLLICLDPLLAALPFDVKKKNLQHDYIRARMKIFGLLPRVEAYTIVGAPERAQDGPLQHVLDLAESRGFSGGFSRDSILTKLEQTKDYAPTNLKPLVDAMVTDVRTELSDPIVASALPCRTAGKVMALHLLG